MHLRAYRPSRAAVSTLYNKCMKLLAASLALLPAIPASAVYKPTAGFVEAVDRLHHTVANPASDVRVRAEGDHVADAMIRARISVHLELTGMPREERPPSAPAALDELYAGGLKRYTRVTEPPPAELADSIDTAVAFKNGKLVDYRSGLKPSQMGLFEWSKDKNDQFIKLNETLALIATRVGYAFAFATVVHEAAHALGLKLGLLSADRVIDGEIFAFRRQYLWLVRVDPTGHKLAQLRLELERRVKLDPEDVLSRKALAYATCLDVLRGTRGEERKIREYVEHLGYREGHSHADHDHPSA